MKNNKNNNISFESCLNKLEAIVEQLESGNVDLEKSVELYEKGIELKNICGEKLKKVDLQIKKIKLVGNYAIPFFWEDGHSAGLYTFEFLKTLHEEY